MTDNRPICGEASKTSNDEGQKLLAKVTDRRKKNNESKKKSTAKKKAAEGADLAELASLEERNAELTAKVKRMESKAARMRIDALKIAKRCRRI